MTKNESLPEDLVLKGPEDKAKRSPQNTTSDGQPLYFAFLANPDAPMHSSDEMHEAKNALDKAMKEKPDVILMCQRLPLVECIQKLQEAA